MAGVALSAHSCNKIEILAADMQAPDFGFSQIQLTELKESITRIIHLAWPMDFNRQLQSFRPQLDAPKSLVHIARSTHRLRLQVKPRIVLAHRLYL